MMNPVYMQNYRCLMPRWISFASGIALLIVFSFSIANAEDSPASKPKGKVVLENLDGEKNKAGQSYKIGIDAIKLKQWDNAISQLEQAVKASPQNSVYHHALGIAYMGSKQPNAGWFHFRKAVRLDPDNVTATVDFMKTWRLLDAQGVFNVGNSLKQVAQTLGKPDQVDDRETRLRLVYGFMSLNFFNGKLLSILDMRNLPENGLRAADGMAFVLPENEWVVAYRVLSAKQGNTEYVKQGETVQSWTELFSSQRFINAAQNKTAVDVMNGIRKSLEARFETVTFHVLDQSDQDVLFAWSIQQNDRHTAQQEIVRLVQGKNDIHRLAYTRKGELQEPDSLESGTEILKQAKLLSAEKLRSHLAKQQREIRQVQLLKDSRKILEKQFGLIRNKETQALQRFFSENVRDKVTLEMIEQVRPHLANLSIDELIDRVEISSRNGTVKAQLINKQGETFTTLVQTKGRWFAETVWLEDFVK